MLNIIIINNFVFCQLDIKFTRHQVTAQQQHQLSQQPLRSVHQKQKQQILMTQFNHNICELTAFFVQIYLSVLFCSQLYFSYTGLVLPVDRYDVGIGGLSCDVKSGEILRARPNCNFRFWRLLLIPDRFDVNYADHRKPTRINIT